MPAMCPVCSTNVTGQQTDCPKCGVDLSAYLAISYTPDILFNEAMQLADEREFRTAYDKLAAAHFLRPHDTEIVVWMSRCLELAGDYAGAMEKLAMLLVDGDDVTVREEYTRLSALYEKQKRREQAPAIFDDEMYAELKSVVLKAMGESVSEIIAAMRDAARQNDTKSERQD